MPRRRFDNQLTPQQIDRIRQLHYVQHWSGPRLAKFFKVDHTTIYYHVGRIKKFTHEGIPSPWPQKRQKVKKQLTYKEIFIKSFERKSVRDRIGNTISWEKREFDKSKLPINVITGYAISLDPQKLEKKMKKVETS